MIRSGWQWTHFVRRAATLDHHGGGQGNGGAAIDLRIGGRNLSAIGKCIVIKENVLLIQKTVKYILKKLFMVVNAANHVSVPVPSAFYIRSDLRGLQ